MVAATTSTSDVTLWGGIRTAVTVPRLTALGFVLLGILGPVLAPYDSTATDLANTFASPGSEHWLGTDHLGRDVLSRLLVGARVSFIAVFAVGGLALTVGVAIGTVAAYAGRVVDDLLMRLADLFLSIPVIILALALLGILGSSFGNLVIALSVSWWPPYARLARARVLSHRRAPHIEALQLAGAPPSRILLRHLLPTAMGPSLVLLSTDVGNIVLMVATLGFLGLGVEPPTPEWGQMLVEARPYLRTNPLLAFAPGLMIAAVVLALNLVGEEFSERLAISARGSVLK